MLHSIDSHRRTAVCILHWRVWRGQYASHMRQSSVSKGWVWSKLLLLLLLLQQLMVQWVPVCHLTHTWWLPAVPYYLCHEGRSAAAEV